MTDILLVDDTIENAAIFSIAMQFEGWTVDRATDGEDALDYLQKKYDNGEDLPRLIITDVSMPRMDGYELCFIVKNDERFKDIPVVIFTAVYPELTKKMALTVQPDDYILKPIAVEKFISTVKSNIKSLDKTK